MAKNDEKFKNNVSNIFAGTSTNNSKKSIEEDKKVNDNIVEDNPIIKKQIGFKVDENLIFKLKTKALKEKTTALALFTDWLENL